MIGLLPGMREPDSPRAPAPLVVAVAPNGARKTKADHPALPLGPEELAQAAAEALDAGAALFHLHVRDREGRHTLDVGAYREATAAIRRAVGDRLIVQATTEAVGLYTQREQIAVVRELRPEAVSLALAELVPEASHERDAAAFFAWLLGERIAPQFILYTPDDVTRFTKLRARGVVPDRGCSVLFVLGRYATGQRSAPADLLPFLERGGVREPWMICAFGPLEAACGLVAGALGGHVRVGFENNTQLADGTRAPSNAALVAQLAGTLPLVGRRLADADAARAILAP